LPSPPWRQSSSWLSACVGIFGWTQLVRAADNVIGGFEMDLIAIYQGFATPFASHSIRPEMFDGPSRDLRTDMD
jgi:hypothetical protein